MARRLWLLVEWIEDNNMFPSYSVVNIDSFAYRDSDLNSGNEIFISLKYNEPRRAKIIRIAENKQSLQDHKEFLERQDQQVKNVLQLCMNTIKKEIKSEQFNQNGVQHSVTAPQINLPHIISANEDDSVSDDDTQTIVSDYKTSNRILNYMHPSQSQVQRIDLRRQLRQTYSPAPSQRRQSLISSTPLPVITPQANIPLSFDQGTQTDDSLIQPPLEKIEAIETVLLHLHQRFQSLLEKVNASTITIEELAPEQNRYSNIVEEINNSWVEESTVENVENNIHRHNISSVVKMEDNNCNLENKENKNDESEKHFRASKVRRMSAQTTNSLDMVPIGDGNAIVPARLLNDIDWNSYTTATRQLLQFIFPRKVLATHSLTGKQSPAHQNKPPKKILDPKLIADIVKTVSSRCGVPKNLVRNSITVKCTDEAKLYRNRQKNRENQKQKSQLYDENVLPSQTPSSDELNLTV